MPSNSPPASPETCGYCKKPFGAEPGKPIHKFFLLLAALALAAAHSSAFLIQEWSQAFCRPCRRKLSTMAVLLAALAASLAGFAIKWAINKGFISMAVNYWTGASK